jgi:hypothetical protein
MKDNKNIEVSAPSSNAASNLSVKLVFDIFSPRPHFIILQRKEYRKSTATDHEIQDVMQLVTEFLANQTQYDKNAILSFHRGKWYQQHQSHFHAHLCVPKKPYCQAAKKMVCLCSRLSCIVTLSCLVRSRQTQPMDTGSLQRHI